jgi:hypothetical protein
MEVLGKIKVINGTVNVSDSFQKRELVVTTDEQYPQHILVEFNQDKCAVLDSYSIGQNVKVSINLRGREWINPEGIAKYFNSLQGWRIEALSEATASVNNTKVHDAEVLSPSNIGEEAKDDLPF